MVIVTVMVIWGEETDRRNSGNGKAYGMRKLEKELRCNRYYVIVRFVKVKRIDEASSLMRTVRDG